MAAQHPVDAVTCDGLPESVEEDGLIGRAVTNEVSTLTVAGQSGQRRILRPLPPSCTSPIWLARRFRSPI